MVSSGMRDAGYSYAVVDDCWSSADTVNWTDHGSPLNLASFSWASANAWAGQTVYRNGKFCGYLFNVNWWQFTA
jgi:hypothetical protein